MEKFDIPEYVARLEQRVPRPKKPTEKKEALLLDPKPEKHVQTEKIVEDYLWIRAWR
jgi:hypothetical protein